MKCENLEMMSDKKKRVTKPRMRTYTTYGHVKNPLEQTTRLARSHSPIIVLHQLSGVIVHVGRMGVVVANNCKHKM